MNSYSPNMLKTFKACPKKYYFKYIQKISMPQKNSFFEKGKKIHALANYYLRGDNIEKLEKALTPEEKSVWKSLKENEFFQKKYIASEYNISSKIGDYWIGGRLDALMQDEHNYYILDYKTGTIPQNPETDFQTMVYLLCVSKMYGDNLKFVYIDLKNNKNCTINFSEEKSKEYEVKINNICEQITKLKLPEEVLRSNICDFCEYGKICF